MQSGSAGDQTSRLARITPGARPDEGGSDDGPAPRPVAAAGAQPRAPAIAYELSARRERGGRSPDAAPCKLLIATGTSRMMVSASATIAIRIGMS
jgi:hypothetical protein